MLQKYKIQVNISEFSMKLVHINNQWLKKNKKFCQKVHSKFQNVKNMDIPMFQASHTESQGK